MQNIYSQSLYLIHQKDQIMLQKHMYVMINLAYIEYRVNIVILEDMIHEWNIINILVALQVLVP